MAFQQESRMVSERKVSMMEQRSEPGQPAYQPPSAQLARQYLAERDDVAQRRAAHIDRRATARMLLLDGVVLAVWGSVLLLGFPRNFSGSMPLLVSLLIWTVLSGSLRDRYGYLPRGREAGARTAVMLIMLVMFFGAIAAIIVGVGVPPWGRLLPGAVALILFTVLAVEEWRRDVPARKVTRQRAPFDRPTRVVTAAIGVALGGLTALSGAEAAAEALAYLVYGVFMFGLVVWNVKVMSGTAPAVGAAWGPSAWTLYGAGNATLAVLIVLDQIGHPVNVVVRVVLGALVAVGFVLIALRGGRRD
ncbi:hypothetical protein PTQ19_05935 [Microbacterium esteraromaticum]|uniref:hypothetical protein n=1 Tax=Microbacterium esteraromaticum TaxID=57043 RepID=UPI002367D51C|nr:hypothetical protein [Microbacterium esteraromaticum]WDH79976.1 hypothetical protein PTQ19_05935 [Microbacterium esteraromaticum]